MFTSVPKTPARSFAPVPAHERIPLLDALRGLALLGIITANLWSFSGYAYLAPAARLALPSYPLDRLVDPLLHVLIDSKFSTLFSMLFGVGFALQLQRATARGVPFRRYFARRMLLLLALAGLHAYLLWFGDILRFYALAGLALLLVARWPGNRLLLGGLVLAVFLAPVLFILNEAVLYHPPSAGDLSLAGILAAFRDGSYGQVLAANWQLDEVRNFWEGAPLTIASTMGKVMLGFWLGRKELFSRPETHQGLLDGWFRWGLLGGLPASVAYWAVKAGHLHLDSLWLAWLPFAVAGGMILHSLFYLSAFVRVCRGRSGFSWLQTFVPVGKMALTNYLLQTVVGLWLFYGYLPGPHLMGEVGPAALLLLGGLIFAGQVVFSHWWLRRHAQGPVEWLWRRLAYGGLGGKKEGSRETPDFNR
ncbi:MAG: hypothetical protein AVDCRST_MAG56-4298 [uncultured Cytophagales bacterium]|uniref:DUF418 domain-containing protein n=1 Tax=uncultured Cytophagales bacterium TaxID=158755 RepID=A0A6J4JTD1_9SPHI|nr:MAG: hypothetical protein AVDCRST_MAG56-4298 [uncultured Cytophagales bacterium]